MTGDSDRRNITRSLIGGMEAIGHEAETALTKKRTTTKSVLRLPDLEHAKAAVLNSPTAWTRNGVIVTPSMSSLTGVVVEGLPSGSYLMVASIENLRALPSTLRTLHVSVSPPSLRIIITPTDDTDLRHKARSL